jgi:hypothetical protein
MSTSEIVARIERNSVFETPELEAELNARLERTGREWRFVRGHRIEVYFPERVRREQRPCNIGLLDRDARSQSDLADWLLHAPVRGDDVNRIPSSTREIL